MKGTGERTKGDTKAGREIIDALEGLVNSISSGEVLKDKYTVRTVELNLNPKPWSAKDIKGLRRSLDVSQPVFAIIMGVKTKTIQAWEQGIRTPKAIANRLLGEIAHDIDRWKKRLRDSVIAK